MHANMDVLCIGGGRKGHAIRLDRDLAQGASHPSVTYGSPRLINNPEGQFSVAVVEVWAFREKLF